MAVVPSLRDAFLVLYIPFLFSNILAYVQIILAYIHVYLRAVPCEKDIKESEERTACIKSAIYSPLPFSKVRTKVKDLQNDNDTTLFRFGARVMEKKGEKENCSVDRPLLAIVKLPANLEYR
jgi:hypothetical protein